MRTEIFVEISGRKDEKQALSGRCGHSTPGTIEE